MAAKKSKKKVKAQDLEPKKDAKGGWHWGFGPGGNPPKGNPPSGPGGAGPLGPGGAGSN
jgi:hypothetical protein